MKQSHLDRLVSCLPAEMQAGFLDSVKDYSPNGNDPVEAYFAALAETFRQESIKQREELHKIQQQLTNSEQRSEQLAEQLAKGRIDTIKAIRTEIELIAGKGLGWRIITNKLVGTMIFMIVASMVANHIIQTKVRSAPEILRRMQTVETRIEDRLDAIGHDIKKATNTNANGNFEKLLIKALSNHIAAIDEQSVYIRMDSTKTMKQRIPLNHNLSPSEYQQLKNSLEIAKVIKPNVDQPNAQQTKVRLTNGSVITIPERE